MEPLGSGSFSGTIDVPKFEQTGDWQLVIVAVDQSGNFTPAFAGKPVRVKPTHFSGSASTGTAINDLRYRLTPNNEATITLTNNGNQQITEEILLQWDDRYKFYLEVKEGATVVASETFEPWGIPATTFSFPVTLSSSESKTYQVKGYALSSSVSVGAEVDPGNPYRFEAEGSGSFHLEVTLTNLSPIDHTAPVTVLGLYDSVQAVIYHDGLPEEILEVAGGRLVFDANIALETRLPSRSRP